MSDAPEPQPDRCAQCGQTDTAPKQHIARGMMGPEGLTVSAVQSFHNDCLSADDEAMLIASAQEAGTGPKASAIIEACKDGTKDDDLRALITSGDLPQAEGLAHKAQLAADRENIAAHVKWLETALKEALATQRDLEAQR